MFERNAVDGNGSARTQAHPVQIDLADGSRVCGEIEVPVTRRLADVLNSAEMFIAFTPYGERSMMLAKSSIRAIIPVALPAADQLDRRARLLDQADPFTILGVDRDAEPEDVHASYRRLVKAYHPDRFAGSDLPDEVMDYLSAVSRRLNTAFGLVQSQGRPAAASGSGAARATPAHTPAGPRVGFGARR